MEAQIQTLKKQLIAAERVTVLTGAGISAESGVPTFRDADGLWKNHRAVDLATPEAFDRNPCLVWEFYNWRRALISKLTFNAAHAALVELEAKKGGAVVAEINLEQTPPTYFMDYIFQGKAGEIVPRLVEGWK